MQTNKNPSRKKPTKKKPPLRVDLLWKELLESFLYFALEVFYPELYCLTDTTKKPVFLNKELRIPGSRRGQKIVDLLAKIHLKTGNTTCLLLHTELQGKIQKEPFNVRMYKYSCLIALRLKEPFVALAIRITPKGESEETVYKTKFLDSESLYKYRTVFIDKLNEESLLSMKHNPVAISTVAAMRIAKAGRSETKRFEYGREMIKLLELYGFPFEVRMRLGEFLEGIANLSVEKFLREFENELKIMYEEGDEDMATTIAEMAPINTRIVKEKIIERSRRKGKAEGRVEGKAEGKIEGKLEVARSMLARSMPRDLVSELTGLSPKEIDNLAV